MNRYFKFKTEGDYYVIMDGILYGYFTFGGECPYIKVRSSFSVNDILLHVGTREALTEVNEEQFLKDIIIRGIKTHEY